MKLSRRQLTILSLIGANIIWGASIPVYKWALADIPPFTFVFLRFSLGAIVILPFTFHKLRIRREDIDKLIIAAISGITLCISFLFLGLQSAPSINASIIISSAPIFLIIFAIFYLKEQPKKKVIYGTWISLIGILLIIIRPLLEQGLNFAIMGNILFLLATIGSCVHTVIMEKVMKRYSALTVAFWTFVIACIPLIPAVLVESGQYNLISELSPKGLLGITYGFLLSSAVAYFLFSYGVKHIKTSEVGIFGYVDPIATALIAYLLLGEVITITFLIGALFVFGGIFIAEGRLHYHPFHLLKDKRN